MGWEGCPMADALNATPAGAPAHQPLARKWRPRSFAEMIGQGPAVHALQNSLAQNRLHPVLLFSGTRGVGKTTLGRLIAKALNCERRVGSEPCGECQNCQEIDNGRFPDFLEIDAASRTRVEETRELLANVSYLPVRGRVRVYLIDEVHMLSGHSFNALLKTLEEPPPHVYFLLATTEPEKVPVTILSRCLRFALRRVSADQIAAHLGMVAQKESVSIEPAALGLLATAAQGSVRDALSLMDLALAYGAGSVREADVAGILGTLDHEQLDRLATAILTKDRQRLGELLGELHALEPDYTGILESLARLFVTLACRIELGSAQPARIADETERQWAGWAAQVDPLDLQLYYEIICKGLEEMRALDDPELTFDMTCVRLLAFEPDHPATRTPPVRDSSARLPDQKERGATQVRADPGAKISQAQAVEKARSSPVELTQGGWPGYVARLDISGMAREILSHTTCKLFDGTTLVLELATQHTGLLTSQIKSRVEAVLRTQEYPNLEIRFETGDGVGDTLAKKQEREEAHTQQQAQAELNRDPNVQKLVERGAEIRSGSVQPTKR